MSLPILRSGMPFLSVPHSQNTAPVLEFNCLYTHDVRKKSKRWQDGILRYHTFNKRVMVYDVPRNFVGDVHWTSSTPVAEGDEITLDDGTVIVEVGENVGSTQTDLTELKTIAKRSTREGGHSSSPVRPMVHRAANIPRNYHSPSNIVRGQRQLKHRSLNALLGTCRGQVGRVSLLSKSPFEMRAQSDENASPDRANITKRQKLNRDGIRTPLASRPAHQDTTGNSTSARPKKNAITARHKFRHDVIDLSKDDGEDSIFMPGFSSNNHEPISSPPAAQQAFQQERNIEHGVASIQAPAVSIVQKPRKPQDLRRDDSEVHDAPHQSPFFTGEKGALQIAPSAPKRRMLLCEEQLSGRSQMRSTAEPRKTQQRILQERLDRINSKARKPAKSLSSSSTVTPGSLGTSEDPMSLSQEDTQQLAQSENRIRPALSCKNQPTPPTTISAVPDVPEESSFRRTGSESGTATLIRKKAARAPGAPVRISAPSRTIQKKSTPQPVTATETRTETIAEVPQQQKKPEKRACPSPRSKKSPQRSVSLNITGSGTSTVMLQRQCQAPAAPKLESPPAPPTQPHAWSREAFDLFEWRPPNWDEENWCTKKKNDEETTI